MLMEREKKRPTAQKWAEDARETEQQNATDIVSVLDSGSIRWLTNIIVGVDETPRWWQSCKRQRISMLLHLFASLERVGLDYPSTTVNAPTLAYRARCKTGLAYKFLRWLLDNDYLVRVTREDGTGALAFWWHANKDVISCP